MYLYGFDYYYGMLGEKYVYLLNPESDLLQLLLC